MPKTTVPHPQVTDALQQAWQQISGVVSGLTDEQWAAPSILPGWSNADMVAHIIGTESILEGREVAKTRDVAALEHVRNPIGELNEHWLDHFRTKTRDEVMAAYDEIIAARTAALSRMTQADFDAEAMTPAGPDTYGRFMRIRIFDCWMHEVDLRDGTDGSAPTQTAAADWALQEIAGSLPFVVGKRAGAPEGSAVRFAVSGAATADIRILVEGRARLVEDFDGGDAAADVTLALDVTDLARLAGGRSTARREAVQVSGDEALADKILDAIDYVI